MQGIYTKYLPCTDTKPTRIKAYTLGGHPGCSVTVSSDSVNNGTLTDGQAHAVVAQKLMRKLHWSGDIVGACTKEGYVFAFVDSWIRPVEQIPQNDGNPNQHTNL